MPDKDQSKVCPFGKACDECKLFTKMYQTDKDGKVNEEWDCAFKWSVILTSEANVKLSAMLSKLPTPIVKTADEKEEGK